MWIGDLKILLAFCIYTALAYHGSTKQDYIKWRERFLPKRPVTTTTQSAVTSANDIYYESLKLRHHSRFPNLDRVMQKIDHIQSDRKKNEVHPIHNKIRHQNLYRTTTTTTTTDEGLFGDDYGDLEYEDDNANDEMNEYDGDDWEDQNEDTNANLDEYDDDTGDHDDPFSDDNDWQAEEATEPPVSAPISSLTKYKWDNYGTRTKVEESRRQHIKLSNEGRATNAVIEHYMKVRQEGQCRKPQPKVVSVQSEHPDPSKTYTPHCTILHRCAEDTGCCASSETKCGPKTQAPVHLYFYTKTLGVAETKVEKLTFYNHTECACLEKSKHPTPVTSSTTENNLTHGLSLKVASYPENIRHCKCPEEFTPKFRYDSRCSCDCEDYNQDCIRMKKGKEFFSLTDRRCIIESQCGIPVCEYGVYMRHVGRCQRKQEKLETFSRMTVK